MHVKSLVGAAQGIRSLTVVAGAACILFAVVGCGSEVVEGSPTPATRAGQPAFDPCLLPDEALVAAGVDPSTQDPDFMGVRKQGWNVCTWAADWYFLTVFATDHGIDEVRANPNNTELAPVAVGSRDAFTYREVTDRNRERCDVAFGTTDESVLIRVAKKGSRDAEEDPCAVVVRTANELGPYLP